MVCFGLKMILYFGVLTGASGAYICLLEARICMQLAVLLFGSYTSKLVNNSSAGCSNPV